MSGTDRLHAWCPRCRVTLAWPAMLSAEDKQRLAAETRASALRGAQLAHTSLGLDLGEAKALAFHIPRQPGVCHRCGAPVSGGVSECSGCHSINLDW